MPLSSGLTVEAGSAPAKLRGLACSLVYCNPSGIRHVVAGVGFEPHDLRVMSPTSYQTAPSRAEPPVGIEPTPEVYKNYCSTFEELQGATDQNRQGDAVDCFLPKL